MFFLTCLNRRTKVILFSFMGHWSGKVLTKIASKMKQIIELILFMLCFIANSKGAVYKKSQLLHYKFIEIDNEKDSMG